MTIQDTFVEAARSFCGTPFRHQGRIPHVGLDCAGVVCAALVKIGVEHNDYTNYARNPHGATFERVMGNQDCIDEIPVDEMQHGDILLMRFTGEPQHLAVHAGKTIIHAYMQAGKCCEHDFTPEWVRRVVMAFRLKDCAHEQ